MQVVQCIWGIHAPAHTHVATSQVVRCIVQWLTGIPLTLERKLANELSCLNVKSMHIKLLPWSISGGRDDVSELKQAFLYPKELGLTTANDVNTGGTKDYG